MQHKAGFSITEDEAAAAARLVAHKQIWSRPIFTILIGLILALVAILALIEPQALDNPMLFALGGVAVVLMLMIRLVVPFHARRHYRQSAALRDEIEAEWNEKGIRFSSAHGNSNFAWNEFYRWAENESLILLYQSQMLYNIIPKRVLRQGELTDLLSWIEKSGLEKR